MRSFFLIFLLTLPSLAQKGGKYVPANDAQPLIRRDLIPLDVASIRDLAENLAILADGPPATSAHLLRNRVQAVTLSLRLAPAQPRAREILQSLTEGQTRAALTEHEIKESQRKTTHTATWLVALPSDSEGHRLGQLLLDILQPISKEEKVLAQHDTDNAAKRWKGVVARLAAFQSAKKPEAIQPEPVKPEPEPQPEPKPETPAPPSYATTALITEVPMIAGGAEKTVKPTAGLVKTSLVIIKGGGNVEIQFTPKPPFSTDPIKNSLINYFKSIKKDLPKGHILNVNTNERSYLAQNRNNLTAPLAMMVDAALSGRPLRRHTYLFADFKTNGLLYKPAEAWALLLALKELNMPKGSRILVGQGLLEEITGLLVLQKAEFFTNFEVIEVANFQAARELFYQDGKPPAALSSAIEAYQEVREKALTSTNLASFLSLSAVESRLIKARDFFPAHLSARMLATQAIRRPAYFTRYMFAQELDLRLQETSLFNYEANKTPPGDIKDTYKEAREVIDSLSRLIERSEREILKEAEDLIKTLNLIGRGSSDTSREKEQERVNGIKEFQTNLLDLRKKLRKIYQVPENK